MSSLPNITSQRVRRASVVHAIPLARVTNIQQGKNIVRVGVWNVQDFGAGPSGRWEGGRACDDRPDKDKEAILSAARQWLYMCRQPVEDETNTQSSSAQIAHAHSTFGKDIQNSSSQSSSYAPYENSSSSELKKRGLEEEKSNSTVFYSVPLKNSSKHALFEGTNSPGNVKYTDDNSLDKKVAELLSKKDVENWSRPKEELKYALWSERVRDLEDHLAKVNPDIMVILEVQLKSRRIEETTFDNLKFLLYYDAWVAYILSYKNRWSRTISSILAPDNLFNEENLVSRYGEIFDRLVKNSSTNNTYIENIATAIFSACNPNRKNEDLGYAGWKVLRQLLAIGVSNVEFSISEDRKRLIFKFSFFFNANISCNVEINKYSPLTDPEQLVEIILSARGKIDITGDDSTSSTSLSSSSNKKFAEIYDLTEDRDCFDFDSALWNYQQDDIKNNSLPMFKNQAAIEALKVMRSFDKKCKLDASDECGTEDPVMLRNGRATEIYRILKEHAGPNVTWELGPDTAKTPIKRTIENRTICSRRDGETILVRMANGWMVKEISCWALAPKERPAFLIECAKSEQPIKPKDLPTQLLLIAVHAPAPDRILDSEAWFSELKNLVKQCESVVPTILLGDFNTGKTTWKEEFIKEFYEDFLPDAEVHFNIETSVKMSGEHNEMFSEPYDKILILKEGKLHTREPNNPGKWIRATHWWRAEQVRRYSDHCFVTSDLTLIGESPQASNAANDSHPIEQKEVAADDADAANCVSDEEVGEDLEDRGNVVDMEDEAGNEEECFKKRKRADSGHKPNKLQKTE